MDGFRAQMTCEETIDKDFLSVVYIIPIPSSNHNRVPLWQTASEVSLGFEDVREKQKIYLLKGFSDICRF